MSDEIFPLALIEKVSVTKSDRTLMDEFEAGNTATRNVWSQYYYKRQFSVVTTPLTLAEFRYLRSFFHLRGTWDSFWFRDNVGRDGNAKVRFSKPFPLERNPATYQVSFQLDEVAPIRSLPEWEEIATAAGATPLLGYDPNREIYLYNQGSAPVVSDLYDIYETNHAPWAGSGRSLAGTAAQYQYFQFAGGNYASTAGTVAGLSGTKPACSIFAMVKQSTNAADAVIFATGGTGATASMGLMLNSSNYYTPFIGGTGTWTNAKELNSSANSWRSMCVTYPSAADTIKLYSNGFLKGTDSVSRSFSAGKARVGADLSGTKILNGSSALANAHVGQVLLFASELTLAQVKALHNLFGYQHGLSVV